MVLDSTWLFVSALTEPSVSALIELHVSFNRPVPCVMLMPESSVMMTDTCMLGPVRCALCAVLLTSVPAATLLEGLWFRSILPFRNVPLLLQSNELGASITFLLVPAWGLPLGGSEPPRMPGVGAGPRGGWLLGRRRARDPRLPRFRSKQGEGARGKYRQGAVASVRVCTTM